MHYPILILFGPTASGKSVVASAIADAIPSVIINADAMQVYKELCILTARPGEQEETKHPHTLYGSLPANSPCSAGIWTEHAKAAIERTWAEQRLPIVVGGTGLYIRALMEGLSEIPDVSAGTREKTAALMRELGPKQFHAVLKECDPVMASKLRSSDTQRLMRAYEVLEDTGKSLSIWQEQPKIPPLPQAQFMLLTVDIPRDVLYDRCNMRFDAMLKSGALEEVKSLAALKLSAELPVMRALGVPELLGYIKGSYTLEQAAEKAKQAIRNYAKRQLTWGRNQFKDALPLPHDLLANPTQWAEMLQKIRNFVDPAGGKH